MLWTSACGVQGAAEGEPGRGKPADGALFDHPGDVLGVALLQQHPRYGSGDPEAEVDDGVDLDLGRGPASDHLLQTELDRFDVVEIAMLLTGERRVVERLGGLHLVRGDHDRVDQDTGNVDGLGGQLGLRQPFHLSDDDAAVVVRGVRLIQGAEGAALLLVRQVAVRIGGGGPDDRDVDLDRRIEQVVGAADLHQLDEVVGDGVHLRAGDPRVGVRAQADLGQHPRLSGRGRAVHLEQHPGWDVERLDLVAVDQLADQRRVELRAAGGVGARQHPAQLTRPAQVVDPFDSVHVAGRDRVQRGQLRR